MNREPEIYALIGAIVGIIITALIMYFLYGTTNNSNEKPQINHCVLSEEYMNNCKMYATMYDLPRDTYSLQETFSFENCCNDNPTYEAYITKQVNEKNFIKTFCSEKGAKYYTNK